MKNIYKKSKLHLVVLLIATAVTICGKVNGQAPAWLWSQAAGGTSEDIANSIAVDASGNTYVTGNFRSPTITFGSTTLICIGSWDVFIVKYDVNGTVVWAKSAVGSNEDVARGIAVDANGNSYITGYFLSTTLTFGSTTLTNTGNRDIFLAKYDASGNVVWAKSAVGADGENANGITVDGNGNPIVIGSFFSSPLTFGSTAITNINSAASNIFVVKYNSSGTVVWAKSIGGSLDDDGTGIAADATGNSYITGNYRSYTIAFGSTTLSKVGFEDVFIAKYDANGNAIWAKSGGGIDNEESNNIAVDGNGNCTVTGYFESPTIAFGGTTLTNNGGKDVFIANYNSSGTLSWAKVVGGSNYEIGQNVAMEANGNIYVVGYFSGSTLTIGATTLTNSGGEDIFIAKYNLSGIELWAKQLGGGGNDRGLGIDLDAGGSGYVTGYFWSNPITFGSTSFTPLGQEDMFVAKLSNVTGLENSEITNKISIYPNPSNDLLFIVSQLLKSKNATVTITDIAGKIVFSTFESIISSQKIEVNTKDFVEGIYLLKIQAEDFVETKKVVIAR